MALIDNIISWWHRLFSGSVRLKSGAAKIVASVVFTLVSMSASAQLTKLVDFAGATNGYEPWGSLIYDGTFLYGMTSDGGASNLGVIFKVKPDGTGFVKLLDFAGATNGSGPFGSLFSDGTFLYGMTSAGGATNNGTIFKILTDGTGYVKLLDFAGASNGNDPYGSLISDGTFLYGLTSGGGTSNMGTIFKIMLDGTGFVKLLDFTGTANGAFPYGDLILDGSFLYGVASQGGTNGDGTIYKIGTDGTGFLKLLNFAGNPTNGSGPLGSLISDGTYLYGTTEGGGTINDGTVFRIRPDGTGFSTLQNFDINNLYADSPFGSLIFVGPFLYGMTYFGGVGGTNNYGTIFRIMPDGTGFDKLWDFTTVANGWLPNGSLVSDGAFLYGMTQQGGTSDGGTLFKLPLPVPPTITNFTPISGDPGTSVTITGTNFSIIPLSNTVKFNGTTSIVTASTTTSITTTVPASATTGNITVTVAGSTATSATPFTVTNPVVIPQLEWATVSIGSLDTFAESMTTDPSGNVYTTGDFSGTTDFDPGPGTFNLTSAGNFDGFISKFNTAGELEWAIRIGGTGSESFRTIANDAAGNVYLTGSVVGPVDFDPGPGNTTLSGAVSFICKFDTNGNFIWVVPLPNTVGGSFLIKIDAGDNVCIAGTFTGSVDFDPGASVNNLTSAGSGDIFALKLSSAGNFVWARRMGSTLSDAANDLALDVAGNFHMTGTFNGTVDFNPGAGTANLTSAGGNDAFVSKLDASGNYVWARRVGNTANFDVGNGIVTDAAGNVLTTGTFSTTVDFDPGAAVTNLASAGAMDVFVLKLDAAGNFAWARSMGGTSNDLGLSLVADASGNVYTTGEYRLTADFDPGPSTFNLITSSNIQTFISKFDAAGDFLWALSTQGSGSVAEDPVISLDPSENIIVAGWLEDGFVDFDPGPCVVGLGAGPAVGAWVLKLSPTAAPSCAPTIAGFTPNAGPVGTSVIITGTNFDPTPSGNTVSFSGVNAFVVESTSTSITVIVPPGAITGPLSVIVGSFSATSSGSFTVIPPAITFPVQPSAASSCTGGSASFVVVASGDNNLVYQWQVDNAGFVNLSDDATNSGVNTATLTISNVSISMSGATYRVLVRGDATVDTPSSTASLTVNPNPAPPVVSGGSGCAGASVVLTASGTVDGQFRWYTVATGGTVIAGETNSSYTTPSLLATTSYFVSIVSGTCESIRTEAIATIAPAPSAPVTIGEDRCSPGTFSLTATGSSDGNYRWYTAPTGGAPLAGEVNSVLPTTVLSTTTSFYASIHDGTCESGRTEVVAGLITAPAAPTIVNPATVCASAPVTLTASGGTNGNYRWYDGGTLISGEVNGTYTVSALAATKTFQVAIVAGVCESAKSQIIAAVAVCTSPAIVSTASAFFLDGAVTIDLRPLISDPENNLDESSLQIAVGLSSGAPYTLNGFSLTINYAGIPYPGEDVLTISICDMTALCVSEIVTIELAAEITVFNALSPNNDDKNEIFYIQHIDALPETKSNKVVIFNRWGDVVFETKDYDNATRVFRGLSSNGDDLPSGTYFYRIAFDSNAKTLTGYISLKR